MTHAHLAHDTLVKAIFANPETMAGVLEVALPRSLTELLDLATLTRVAGLLPEPAPSKTGYTDLLFSAQTSTPERTLIYLLVEFLMEADPLMPLRILEHDIAIFDSWCARGSDLLPPVLPVIIYLGPEGWRVPRAFADCYDLPADDPLLDLSLNFELLVENVSSLSDEELQSRRLGAVATLALLCQRHAGDRSLMTHLERWEDLWNTIAIARGGGSALEVIARYLIDVSPHVDRERLRRLIPGNATS